MPDGWTIDLEQVSQAAHWLAGAALLPALVMAAALVWALRRAAAARRATRNATADLDAIRRQLAGEKIATPVVTAQAVALGREIAALHAGLEAAGPAAKRPDGQGWLINALDHAVGVVDQAARDPASPAGASDAAAAIVVLRQHLLEASNCPTLAAVAKALVPESAAGERPATPLAPLFRLEAALAAAPVPTDQPSQTATLAVAIGLGAAVARIVLSHGAAAPPPAGPRSSAPPTAAATPADAQALRASGDLAAAARALDAAIAGWTPNPPTLRHVLALDDAQAGLVALQRAFGEHPAGGPGGPGFVQELVFRHGDSFDAVLRADLLASTYLAGDELPPALTLPLAAAAILLRALLAADGVVVVSPRLLTGPEDPVPEPCDVTRVFPFPLQTIPSIRRRIDAVRQARPESIRNELRIDCMRLAMHHVHRGMIRVAKIVLFEPREWT